MRRLQPIDRVALVALAVADVGVGVFLIAVGTLPGIPVVHTVVGVVSILLALPAAVSALTGRLPSLSDEGMLVNVGVMTFMTAEVITLPADLGQKVGLALLLAAAAMATIGLYLRLFGVLHLRPRGRRIQEAGSGAGS